MPEQLFTTLEHAWKALRLDREPLSSRPTQRCEKGPLYDVHACVYQRSRRIVRVPEFDHPSACIDIHAGEPPSDRHANQRKGHRRRRIPVPPHHAGKVHISESIAVENEKCALPFQLGRREQHPSPGPQGLRFDGVSDFGATICVAEMLYERLRAISQRQDKPGDSLVDPIVKLVLQKRPPFDRSHGLREIRHDPAQAGAESAGEYDRLQVLLCFARGHPPVRWSTAR